MDEMERTSTDVFQTLTWCVLFQAAVPCTEQHLPPHGCSQISSAGRGGRGGVLQENAALEPETVRGRQATSVCGQPRPGGLSSGVSHTHSHTQLLFFYVVLLELLR